MSAGELAQARLDSIAKPLRALGRLEELIVQLAEIQGTEDVRISPRCALVFCGDHGVVAEGVSQSGSEVTTLVARAIAEGTSNVSLMAASSGTDVLAVEMEDRPGGLYEVVRTLAEAGINIEYSYAYSGKRCAVVILRVENIDRAAETLLEEGVRLLEISQFT